MITKATAFLGVALYILFKCDVKHCMHCLVLTDTYLYTFTKGRTYLVNHKWRLSVCLRYGVGCYPCACSYLALTIQLCERERQITVGN